MSLKYKAISRKLEQLTIPITGASWFWIGYFTDNYFTKTVIAVSIYAKLFIVSLDFEVEGGKNE
jgi:TRAP-type uncharacterized transport system fused permease subunit